MAVLRWCTTSWNSAGISILLLDRAFRCWKSGFSMSAKAGLDNTETPQRRCRISTVLISHQDRWTAASSFIFENNPSPPVVQVSAYWPFHWLAYEEWITNCQMETVLTMQYWHIFYVVCLLRYTWSHNAIFLYEHLNIIVVRPCWLSWLWPFKNEKSTILIM